jgi:predicted nuclease with TOPRIM domain
MNQPQNIPNRLNKFIDLMVNSDSRKQYPVKFANDLVDGEIYVLADGTIQSGKGFYYLSSINLMDIANTLINLSNNLEGKKTYLDLEDEKDLLEDEVRDLKDQVESLEDEVYYLEADNRALKEELKSIEGELENKDKELEKVMNTIIRVLDIRLFESEDPGGILYIVQDTENDLSINHVYDTYGEARLKKDILISHLLSSVVS